MTKYKKIIGVDESGKGDFFGPLVIGALLASEEENDFLQNLGVRDSKLISDNKLLTIDERLRDHFPTAVLVIMPEEYNQKYEVIKNLNKLLAWGHASIIDQILIDNEADLAISDKFGKSELIENELRKIDRTIEIKQFVRGESILQVAAGSIIARAAFLRTMSKLSSQFKFDIPRGASAKVDEAGRQLVDIYGVSTLKKLAKLHFKNYGRVTAPTLFK